MKSEHGIKRSNKEELERLTIMKEKLQSQEYKLPCKISALIPVKTGLDFENEKSKESNSEYTLRPKKIGHLNYKELSKLVKVANVIFSNELIRDRYYFSFKNFSGQHCPSKNIEVSLSEDEFEKIKAFFEKIEEKIEKINKKVEKLKNNVEENEKE